MTDAISKYAQFEAIRDAAREAQKRGEEASQADQVQDWDAADELYDQCRTQLHLLGRLIAQAEVSGLMGEISKGLPAALGERTMIDGASHD